LTEEVFCVSLECVAFSCVYSKLNLCHVYLQPDFRVAVTGSVVELDKAVTIVKKLKLQGTPYKIYKNTAFIQVCDGS